MWYRTQRRQAFLSFFPKNHKNIKKNFAQMDPVHRTVQDVIRIKYERHVSCKVSLKKVVYQVYSIVSLQSNTYDWELSRKTSNTRSVFWGGASKR